MTRHNGSSAPARHGLRNEGATCYLNSVLQVLFMTKEFREAVQRSTATNCDIDPELNHLFAALLLGTASTKDITKKLGIKQVHEQQDAAEFFEKILCNTSPKAAQIFQGLLTHRNICFKCKSHTDNEDPFWSLPLALVDSENSLVFSVMDGIKRFFCSVHVSGDNQMYCDQCQSKTDATFDIEIKHHPEVLMLLLKRFKFDYCSKRYIKDERNVEFSYTLQMQNQSYELYAFVEHFGSLRGGHYTATINSQDDEKWYNFNDTVVTLADYQSFKTESTEKSKSVYLLFYKKKQNNPEGIQLECTAKTSGGEEGRDREKRPANSQDVVQDDVRRQDKRHRRKDTGEFRENINEARETVCILDRQCIDKKGDEEVGSLKINKRKVNKREIGDEQENQKSHERKDGQQKRGMLKQNYGKDVHDQNKTSQMGLGQDKTGPHDDHVVRKIRVTNNEVSAKEQCHQKTNETKNTKGKGKSKGRLKCACVFL